MFGAAVWHFFVSLTTFVKKREETTSVKHITHTHKKNDDDDDFEENFEQRSLLLCPLLRRENCFCRPGSILFTRSFCLFIVFFFFDHFSHHHRRVLAALVFFFSSSVSTPPSPRRVVVYVAFCLSVGVDLGLKGVSLESSSSSSSVSSFRRKQRIGEKNGFFFHRNSLFAGCEKY